MTSRCVVNRVEYAAVLFAYYGRIVKFEELMLYETCIVLCLHLLAVLTILYFGFLIENRALMYIYIQIIRDKPLVQVCQ